MVGTNRVWVPIFELDGNGELKPNPVFHRSYDKLHSRCIEYPFAAWQLGEAERLLDVGTAQADPVWVRWLTGLPIEVHATDYDHPPSLFGELSFHRADVRRLPLPDDAFDKILAVSLVEHVGLRDPQVRSPAKPVPGVEGDAEAVRELARVLKPGGELIMTVPFGVPDGAILGGTARGYTADSIARFEACLDPVRLHYYEYQYSQRLGLCTEFASQASPARQVCSRLLRRWRKRTAPPEAANPPELSGVATWRRRPMEDARATHVGHIDGVLCGVWRKP